MLLLYAVPKSKVGQVDGLLLSRTIETNKYLSGVTKYTQGTYTSCPTYSGFVIHNGQRITTEYYITHHLPIEYALAIVGQVCRSQTKPLYQ